jgi:hypothetical protein
MNSEAHQKVHAEHLQRKAFLYVRQSTVRQVRENIESTKRQYGLRDRALALRRSSFEVPSTAKMSIPFVSNRRRLPLFPEAICVSSVVRSSRSRFDLATAALYLLEIRSNSSEFGSSINAS